MAVDVDLYVVVDLDLVVVLDADVVAVVCLDDLRSYQPGEHRDDPFELFPRLSELVLFEDA